jgi:hypothetical protein
MTKKKTVAASRQNSDEMSPDEPAVAAPVEAVLPPGPPRVEPIIPNTAAFTRQRHAESHADPRWRAGHVGQLKAHHRQWAAELSRGNANAPAELNRVAAALAELGEEPPEPLDNSTEAYTRMRHREVLTDPRRLERLKARRAALQGKTRTGLEGVELRELEQSIAASEAEMARAV